ncbi:MAG TPA: tetratricopeptide repeat protein [Bryobacteraceae bacterium]
MVTVFRLLIVLICAACLFAQQPIDKAWQLVRSGQREEAMQVLTGILRSNPRDVDARLLYGSLLMEAGKQQQSISQLEEAVALRPKSAEAQNALGEAYNRFGETEPAERAFKAAVSLNPRFAVAQTNLGLVLLQEGKPDQAALHLDEALRIFGKNPDASYPHYLRAKVYSAQNKPKEAEKELAAAVALKPDFAEAWSDLGQARKQNLNSAGALAAFDRAVKANPNDAVAQYRLGAEYLRQGKPHQAVEHLERSYRIEPKNQSTLNSLQAALRRDGKTEEANKIRQELAQLLRDQDKANQNALMATKVNNEGAALEKAGDLRGAVEKYREAVSLNPNHVGMRVNYAIALLRLGQWTEGLNQLHTALKMNPHDAQLQAAMRDALSQAPKALVPDWHDEWSASAHPESR